MQRSQCTLYRPSYRTLILALGTGPWYGTVIQGLGIGSCMLGGGGMLGREGMMYRLKQQCRRQRTRGLGAVGAISLVEQVVKRKTPAFAQIIELPSRRRTPCGWASP